MGIIENEGVQERTLEPCQEVCLRKNSIIYASNSSENLVTETEAVIVQLVTVICNI